MLVYLKRHDVHVMSLHCYSGLTISNRPLAVETRVVLRIAAMVVGDSRETLGDVTTLGQFVVSSLNDKCI